MTIRKPVSIRSQVEKELKANGAAVVSPSLAALALHLAVALDARPSALMAKELRETMVRLTEMAPPKRQEDEIDQLRSRRESRLSAGGAGA